jgi:DNA repair protein RadD
MSDLHFIEEENHKILVGVLSSLSEPILQRALGIEIIDNLKNFGFQTDNYQLAENLVSIHGSEVFSIEEITNALSERHGLEKFKWGLNRKSTIFLDELGITRDFLPSKTIIREPEFQCSSEFNLHEFQQAVKSTLSEFLLDRESETSIMVQMPTGSGKTRVAMEAIYDFLRIKTNKQEDISIIWLAHTDELCEQAVESFEMGWKNIGSFEVNVLRLWAGNAAKIEAIPAGINFAVCSMQSAYSMLKTQNQKIENLFTSLRSKTKILIIDEAHISKASTYEATIEFLSKEGTQKIGLTATPGRHGLNQDNEETHELAKFFENNKIDIASEFHQENAIQYLQSEGILSKVTQEPLMTGFKIDMHEEDALSLINGSDISKKIINQVANDKDRNKKIVMHLQYLANNLNKKIIVFAASVAHANLLATILSATGIQSRSITQGTSTSNRRAAIEDFKNNEFKVLTNYGVLSTGFDDPMVDCIVIARPTFSVVLYSQMVGRGLRGIKNGGTKECLLVDVVDNIIGQPDLKQAYNFFEGEWNG